MKEKVSKHICQSEGECPLHDNIGKGRSLEKSIRVLVGGILLAVVITFSALNVVLGIKILDFLTGSAMVFLAGAGSVVVDGDYLKHMNNEERSYEKVRESINDKIDKLVPDKAHHELPVELGDWVELSLVKNISEQWVYIYDSRKRSGEITWDDEESLGELYKVMAQMSSLSGFDVRVKYISGRITAFSPVLSSDKKVVGVFLASIDRNVVLVFRPFIVAVVSVIGIAVFLVFVFIGKSISKRMIRPLQTLEKKISALAKAGEDKCGDFIIFDDTFDEVKKLANATNMVVAKHHKLIDRLNEQKTELFAQNQQLEAQQQELLATLDELRETQMQLVQREKMASLGQLTAGIAHEINTPLGAINSNTDMIDMFIKGLDGNEGLIEKEKAINLLNKIKKSNDTNIMAVGRIIEIVRTLKNFSRLDEADFQEADLHQGLDSVLLLAHHHLKHNIKVIREYGEIPLIECYPNQLNQVFMNLVVNAAQAIDGEGEITIRSGIRGDMVFVEIKDNGEGIPPENLSRIFDPGYTTKGVGVGTGLGLSICYNIVKKHNGTIEVESEPGRGSLIRVLLPVKQPPKQ
ncbi:MAG: sensor histidine kinase [Bacillota bacterium]